MTTILTDAQLKQLRLIQILLLAGPFLLFVAIITLYASGFGFSNLESSRSVLLIALTAMHFAVLGLLYPISMVLPIRFLNRFKKTRGQEASGKIVISAHIIKLVLGLIPAIVGLVITLVALTKGVIYEEGLYWVNMVSFFIAMAQNIMSYPNHTRIEQVYGSTFN
ncbi:hypothetical protein EP331_00680 [bacterium]|nr:MAG: hypothetical protein EP331_00680 [bacterium]